jgi:hypothetical protein
MAKSKSRIRRFTFNYIITAGTVLGTYTKRFQLDASFKRAFGYLVFENINPGVAYQIGIKDDNQIYQDLTNSNDYIASNAVAKSDRYTKADIKAGENFITVSIALLANAVTDMNIDVVFLQTNDDDPQELTPDEAGLINLLRRNTDHPVQGAGELKEKGVSGNC